MKKNTYTTPVVIAIALESKDIIALSNGIQADDINMSVGIEEL